MSRSHEPPECLTLVEKLATKHAIGLPAGAAAKQGDFITIRPKHIMTHDNTSAVMGKFKELFKGLETCRNRQGADGAGHQESAARAAVPRIHDPRQPVFAIDHDIQNKTPENLGKYAKIESFAKEQPGGGIDFYPAGTGISHQVMVEQGYVTPGSMVVGSDSHSNLYGALCCLGTPVVRTDAASIWATGVTWWQVPPVARCVLKGRLQPGVVGKDVIVALCGLFNKDEVLNHAVEFVAGDAHGEGFRGLSIDQRMTISNMTTEWGALVGVFPFDEVLRAYLYSRADYFSKGKRPGTRRPDSLGGYTRADVDRWWSERAELAADAGAKYAIELELDLATIVPHVSGPNTVKTMVAVPEIEKQRVKINKAWLMSCVNARYEDIAEAARIFSGGVRGSSSVVGGSSEKAIQRTTNNEQPTPHRVAPGVEFYLAAASAEVQERAKRDGHWQTLIEAGAIELPPGCGTCIGLGLGTIKAGEVGISATNRNFEGRMGDREGLVYLGSPAVVAASAIAGYIAAPPEAHYRDVKARIAIRRPSGAGSAPAGLDSQRTTNHEPRTILPGFPERVRGRAIWLPRDNLNTDGIYSGKLTYRDDVPPAEMAAASFNNYDPEFVKVAKAGDIVVSGRNFGTGSSREQAATCLKHFGIPAVIAYSFSETYKRNAFNNGFMVFECPGLVEWLEVMFRSPSPPGRGVRGEGSAKKGDTLRRELLEFARTLRQEHTDAESLMWFMLRDRRLGDFKFRRQHPVDPYVLDYYCDHAKLAIELNGGQHNAPDARRKDERRTALLEAKGIRVLRFWDHEVLTQTESVLEAIWNALQERTPSPPTPLPGGERGKEVKTILGPEIEIDYRRSVITCEPASGGGKQFPFPPLSTVAQELIVVGGAENVVKRRLAPRE